MLAWGGLGGWLALWIGPLARKVLVSLGIASVTFVGLELTVNSLLNQAATNWASGPVEVMQILSRAGANTALSIIAGACVARLTLSVVKQFLPS
jgi:Protein of unknown function (DUF2523)